MAVVLLIALVATLVAGFDLDSGDFVEKYAKIKVLESCLSKDVVMEWKKRFMEACNECRSQPGSPIQPDMSSLSVLLQRYPGLQGLQDPPSSRPDPHNQVFGNFRPFQPMFVYVPSVGDQPFPMGYFPNTYPQMSHHRIGKRSANPALLEPASDQEAVEQPSFLDKMKMRITEKISNMSCALRKVGLIDNHLMPNYSYLMRTIQQLPVSDPIKFDLMEGQDFCREFSMCLPVHKLKNPIAKELGYAAFFYRCYSKKLIMSCMKQDLKQYLSMEDMPQDWDGFGLSKRFLQGVSHKNSDIFMDVMTDMFQQGL